MVARLFGRPVEVIDRQLKDAALRKDTARAVIAQREEEMAAASEEIDAYRLQIEAQDMRIEVLLDERNRSVRMAAEQEATLGELMEEGA